MDCIVEGPEDILYFKTCEVQEAAQLIISVKGTWVASLMYRAGLKIFGVEMMIRPFSFVYPL